MNEDNNVNKEIENNKDTELEKDAKPQIEENATANDIIKNEEPIIIQEIPVEEKNLENKEEIKEEPSKKNKLPLIILIVGIIMALLGIVLLIVPKLSNKELTADDFNGIYKNNKGEAFLYSKDGSLVHVTIDLDNYSFTHQEEVKDNKLVLESGEDKTTITLSKDKKTISVESNIKELNNLSFKKEKEYSKEQFYNNNYGNTKYVDSKYNGVYKNNDIELKMFQKYDDTVRIYVKNENSSTDTELIIKDDKTLEGEFGDTIYKITFNDDKLTFETTKGKKEYDGEYEREKTLSMDEIMESFY